ncbi:hypothetical protein O1L55_30725 [Streptomyces albulus]|nr:hypothetical protein [Streptomyces noursei]
MRDTSSTGRSAATGGCRMLLLLALLALLFTALTAGYADATASGAGACPTRINAPAPEDAAERTCDTTGHVLAPSRATRTTRRATASGGCATPPPVTCARTSRPERTAGPAGIAGRGVSGRAGPGRPWAVLRPRPPACPRG